jgi:AraC-like DNA-binding protein
MYFSSKIIFDLIDFARYQGANVDELVSSSSQIAEDSYVSYELTADYFHQVGKLLNNEALGLSIGELVSLKVSAQVNEIMNNSSSLEDAFSNAVNFSKLISDALECHMEKSDTIYSVVFEENPDWKVQNSYARRQLLDLTLLSTLNSLITYTGYKYCPTLIRMSLPKPIKTKNYYRLFNCRIKFNEPKNEIVFERQIFDKHSKSVEFGLLKSLKTQVQKELSNLSQENEFILEVKKLILNRKPDRITVDEVIKELNFSRRTFHRRLTENNTSFKKIEHELQLKLANSYLMYEDHSIDEISYLLGFADSSSFVRFFKLKTGISPKKFKDQEAKYSSFS